MRRGGKVSEIPELMRQTSRPMTSAAWAKRLGVTRDHVVSTARQNGLLHLVRLGAVQESEDMAYRTWDEVAECMKARGFNLSARDCYNIFDNAIRTLRRRKIKV